MALDSFGLEARNFYRALIKELDLVEQISWKLPAGKYF